MQHLESQEQAKAELETILASGFFAHAPSLVQLLSYVCSKCFEGKAHEIKEYNIATEALGRPPDFDQKKDSIVRVEAHRLRKRLRQYYLTEGAGHSLHIVIPSGHYAPEFVSNEHTLAASPEAVDATTEEVELAEALEGNPADPPPSEPGAPAHPWSHWRWLLAGMAALAALLAAGRLVPFSRVSSRVAKAEGNGAVPTLHEGREVRILAGSSGNNYVDRFGNLWLSDKFYTGGAVFSTPLGFLIRGTQDAALYQSRREGTFSYDIPLQPGVYELHLYFAETLFGEGNIAGGGETSRVFDVLANGKRLVSSIDVVADAPGGNTADEKVFRDIKPGADGYLHLNFPPATNEKAFINAIEIVPGIPGRLHPVRIVARDTSVTSKDGRLWGADRYFIGGRHVLRPDPIKGTSDPELYSGERFGNFTYFVPAAPGRYTVTLRFCESWFGPNKPAGGGVGERIFNAYLNGVCLLRDFDVFKEAGGGDRPLDKVFHGLTPNAQGKLAFSFTPVRNYAFVNAIEVVDEGED